MSTNNSRLFWYKHKFVYLSIYLSIHLYNYLLIYLAIWMYNYLSRLFTYELFYIWKNIGKIAT